MSAFATPSPSKLSRYSRYGSWQVVSEAQFSHGLVADTAPVAVATGGVVDVRDFLFDRPGRVRKRGGSAVFSTLPAAAGGSAPGPTIGCANIAQVPFRGGDKVIAVGNTATGYYAFDASSTSASNLSPLGGFSPNPPLLYNDTLYLLRGASGAAPGKPAGISCTSGGVLGTFDSVAAAGMVGVVHAGYLVLANDGAANPSRVWFSPIPNPESAWDMANAYIDTNRPVTALASVQGVLIVFHAGSCERILGSIPPGSPGENMSLQPLSGQAGCVDAGSIASIGGNIYFADRNGVWVTNGASVTSISSRADGSGIASLWRREIAAGGAIIAMRAGSFSNDYYMVALLSTPTGASWVTRLYLVYSIATGIWTRFALAPIGTFSASSSSLETYAGLSNSPQVVALSDMFADPPIRSVDADGSPVLPRLQSRVLTGGPFLKAFGDGHLTYDVRTAAAAPSALSLSLSKEIEQGGFAFSSNFASIAGPDPARQRFPISGDGHGLSFSLAATVESTKCELYAVEAEHRSYEEQADM